jgi:hypothetical protein
MTVAGVTSRCAFNARGRSLIRAASAARSAQSSGGFGVLSAKDRVLVTENQDLYIFGRTGTGEERKPVGGAAERKVEQA